MKKIFVAISASALCASTAAAFSVQCGNDWCTTSYGECVNGTFVAGSGNPQGLNGSQCQATLAEDGAPITEVDQASSLSNMKKHNAGDDTSKPIEGNESVADKIVDHNTRRRPQKKDPHR